MKKLSLQAKVYILGSILLSAALIVWSLARMERQTIPEVLLLGALGALTLIFKVEGATTRLHYNTSLLVYAFALFHMGPEPTLWVILIAHLGERIVNTYPWYIPGFNIAAYVLPVVLIGLIDPYLIENRLLGNFSTILSILLSLLILNLANHLMVGIVLLLARGESFKKSGVFDFLPLTIDYTMLCMGVSAAVMWAHNPYLIILTLLPLYLIYRTLQVPALERQTETDPKTELYNARYFETSLMNELQRAERFDRPMSVIMGDLDLLRNINNTYGHLAGDAVLVGVAKILKENMREYDIVARFGGEEFAILIPETSPQQVAERINLIRQLIEKAEFEVKTSVSGIKATMSFGIAGRERPGMSANEIVHNADAALYHSKLRGRNRVYLYTNQTFESVSNPGDKAQPGEMPSLPTETLDVRTQPIKYPYLPSTLRETPRPAPSSAPSVSSSAPSVPQSVPSSVSSVSSSAPSVPKSVSRVSFPAWRVNAFIGLLALIAWILFLATFRLGEPVDWIGIGLFAAMVLVTEGMSIDIFVKGTTVSTSAAPILAGTLLFGPPGALALSFTFAAVSLVKNRSKFSRFIFNLSNQLIAGLIYTGLILIVLKTYTELDLIPQLLVCLVASLVVYATTTELISLVIGLDTGAYFRQVWRERFSWLWPYYLTMGFIAYGMIFGFLDRGLVGVLVIVIPLLLLRFSQMQYIEHAKVKVNELREKNTILERTSQEVNRLNEALMNTFAEVIDLRDPYVSGHSRQVANYAMLIAQQLNLPIWQVERIHKASLLHDIGKVGIPDAILLKTSSLTEQEYQQVKKHTTFGADLLQTSLVLNNLIPIVRHHHERYDGTGYPDGKKGEEIPLDARIMAVADAVEAMASDRPYHKALSYTEILAELEKNKGTQFDPAIAQAFIEVMKGQGENIIVNSTNHAQK